MEEATCGKGLAAHSALPARMGELIGALASNLEQHMTALDTSDAAARKEHEAYASLLAKHRRIALELADVAAEMASYRHLPMGPHDEAAMAAPAVREAFERFVAAERALLALLEEAAPRDADMLAQ